VEAVGVAGAKWAGLHPQGVVGVTDKTRGVYSEQKKNEKKLKDKFKQNYLF